MTNNSAHDDIKLLMDIAGEDYKQFLSVLPKVANGDSLRKILSIIEDIERDSTIQSLKEVNSLFLSTKDGDYEILFKTLKYSGDKISFAEPLKSFENEVGMDDSDILAIKEGHFKLDLYTKDDECNYSLSNLLEDMQLYEIGRPSNFAKNISSLVDADLLSISDNNVTLTTLGVSVIKILMHEEPSLSSPTFSKTLNVLTEFIGAGHPNITDLTNELIKKSFAIPIDTKSFWAHEDEMYDISDLSFKKTGTLKKGRS